LTKDVSSERLSQKKIVVYVHGSMLAEGKNHVNTKKDGLGGDICHFFFISNDETPSPQMMSQKEKNPSLSHRLNCFLSSFFSFEMIRKVGFPAGGGKGFRF
jgi:hypothetical protein